MPENTFPKVLFIDKDWSSTVLWTPTERGYANYAGYKGLEFPDWLIRKFDFWSVWYEQNLPETIIETLDWGLWEAYGMSLAIDVKRIVGEQTQVFFAGREKDIEIPLIPFDEKWIPPRDELETGYGSNSQ